MLLAIRISHYRKNSINQIYPITFPFKVIYPLWSREECEEFFSEFPEALDIEHDVVVWERENERWISSDYTENGYCEGVMFTCKDEKQLRLLVGNEDTAGYYDHEAEYETRIIDTDNPPPMPGPDDCADEHSWDVSGIMEL